MRERSLDQFESIFERASIPVLDIQELDLKRIAAVLRGDELDESVLRLAQHLSRRFGADVRLHWSATLKADQVAGQAEAGEFASASGPFGSTAELVGQISIGRSQLVLLPDPAGETPALPPDAAGETPTLPRAVDIDALVQGTAPPILLIRRPVEHPQAVFQRILHSLTGNFQQTQNFAHSFALVEESGAIVLLHTIDQTELHDVRDALRVSPDIAAADGEELLQGLTRHGERYLKAVVAASRKFPYDVSYRLAVGEVRATVERELAAGDHGLLVVGRHQEGYSHVEAEDYQLMHQVRHVPVLAL